MERKRLAGLIAVLLLSIVMIGNLWGQDFKFDGYINSGLGIVASDREGEDATIKAYGVDSEQNGYRIRLHGNYTAEAGNLGIKFRLQSQGAANFTIGGVDRALLSFPYVYGFVKFADDKFNLLGGIIDDNTFAPSDWLMFSDRIDAGLGAMLKATPISGLDLGFGVYTINREGGPNNEVLSVSNFGYMPKIKDAKFTYSAAYTMPEVFRLSTSLRWKNKGANSALTYRYDGTDESARLYGEFRFLAVKELTAVIAARFDKIEDFSNRGDILFSETFNYKIDDSLTLGLNAGQYFFNRTNAAGDSIDTQPSLLFNLWGSYALGKVVPRLDLAYFIGGRDEMTNLAAPTANPGTNPAWRRRGFVAQGALGAQGSNPRVKDVDDDQSVFSIRPSVKFNLDRRTSVEIGDLLSFNSINYTPTTAKPFNNGDKKSLLTNVFYIDLRWMF